MKIANNHDFDTDQAVAWSFFLKTSQDDVKPLWREHGTESMVPTV